MSSSKPYVDKVLSYADLGDNVPRRNGKIAPIITKNFYKLMGWKVKGEIPNIKQAVVLAVPHTSNIDALYTIPCFLSLDLNLNLVGKKSLFKNPLVGAFMRYSGVIPIDRSKKGSVLQATIDEFKKGKPLFLGIAPEGTRGYVEKWKSGFYYIALGAEVPILPVAMDTKTKEMRFMNLFYPTGDYEADLAELVAMYKDVHPVDLSGLSKPLKDLNGW